MTVKIERREVTGVLFNSLGHVYTRGNLQKNNDHTYTQNLTINRSEFEVNRSGERFFELTVSFKLKITNEATGRVIDSGLEHLGSYRVFIK